MLKRTPLKPRKKPLKRGKAPKRSPLVRKVVTRIKAKGKPRFKQGRLPGYLKWIRGLPCLRNNFACSKDGVQAAHIKSRGAGGEDYGNVVPLCRFHHQMQHQIGIKTFAGDFWEGGLEELRRIAAEVYPAQWLKQKELGWPS